MTESAEGFVLREIRYGDTASIVKIYTRDKGLRSFIVKGVRPAGTRSARSSRSRHDKAKENFCLFKQKGWLQQDADEKY